MEHPNFADSEALAILRKVEEHESQKSMSKELGFSIGKVNYILKALIAKGLIKIENFSNEKDKRKYRYLLTKAGIEEKIALTERFIERKKAEYDELVAELERMRYAANGDSK
ncbi:MAG: MarR family EPS-associated transcriptional regulator [Campylobacteraceae bacterium]|nr:MarR family EPS-associated transcriptional regulator [Campylobacteraceae bacterium]